LGAQQGVESAEHDRGRDVPGDVGGGGEPQRHHGRDRGKAATDHIADDEYNVPAGRAAFGPG
jgi:hypothetical protein